MTREWVPGDMAVATDGSTEFRVIRMKATPDYWSAPGEWPVRTGSDTLDFRPLAVFDPESAEDVERLLRGYYAQPGEVVLPRSIANMQAALREFATPTPPKPAEPTGLGAVVEDADGVRWALVDTRKSDVAGWHRCDADAYKAWRFYDGINAVRVLSEGVTS